MPIIDINSPCLYCGATEACSHFPDHPNGETLPESSGLNWPPNLIWTDEVTFSGLSPGIYATSGNAEFLTTGVFNNGVSNLSIDGVSINAEELKELKSMKGRIELLEQKIEKMEEYINWINSQLDKIGRDRFSDIVKEYNESTPNSK